MLYRNQTNTMTQIQLLAQMRITTVPEAVAFLRAMGPINAQIAQVLQRTSINLQHQSQAPVQPMPNNNVRPDLQPEAQEVVEPNAPFKAEDLSTDEGFSEAEVEEKVAKLKAAKKSK